jgi:hypothetical protein
MGRYEQLKMKRLGTSGLPALAIALLMLIAIAASAQTPTIPPEPAKMPASQGGVAPFDMIGFLQFASADAICAPNSSPSATNPPMPAGCKSAGGWVQLNGHVVRVPQNTILQMPARTLTWEEVFEYNSLAPGSESGLAMADTALLPGTFEIHIQGNIVNGTYIAGLIFISQQSLNSSQGFIESLDYANGIMVVNGNKVQINDPLGRFSIGKSPDARFSIDEDNPTVRAQTAFPMCIPRQDPATGDDPLCPQKNRPRDASGNPLMKFTMDPYGSSVSGFSQPTDSSVFAPFEVGDYVTYAGTLMDVNGTRIISAHTIIGNVGIYTSPGNSPAYIAIDVLLQGAPGVPNPAFPQEATSKARVEGFTTDSSRPVDIFAIDQDCNGVTKDRAPWAFEFTPEAGPPFAGVQGRFRWLPAGGNFLPPARNVGVQIDYPPPTVYNQSLGIIAGRYAAPNFTFIFPENLGVGDPPVPLDFGGITFLTNGSGPWAGFAKQPVGQLNPWPGGTVPALTCTIWPTGTAPPANPIASYTAAASPIVAGTQVTLTAAGSTPTDGPYAWKQVLNSGDPVVTLSTPGAMNSTFSAPTVAAYRNLTFQVTVGGGNTTTPETATVSVPIAPPPGPATPSVRANSSPANPVASFTTVTLSASGVDPANGTLTYTWVAPQGITLTPVAGTNGAQQTFSTSVPAFTSPQTFTFSVTGTSSVSGLVSPSASVGVTVNPVVDTITITSVTYRTGKAQLTVNATDNTPNVQLTSTLNVTDPATGQPYTGIMGPTSPPVPNNYTIIFTGVTQPTLVIITSNAGGKATSGVTKVTQ